MIEVKNRKLEQFYYAHGIDFISCRKDQEDGMTIWEYEDNEENRVNIKNQKLLYFMINIVQLMIILLLKRSRRNKMANLANIAATNMEHLCNCPEHGYSQSER